MARMSHEQAAEMLVDFELGRLSPRRSAAVEQHVRSCEICQRQGLGHAATERRKIIRQLDRVRPARRVLSRRARGILLFLAVAVIFELIVFELLAPNSTLHQLFGFSPAKTPVTTAFVSHENVSPALASLISR